MDFIVALFFGLKWGLLRRVSKVEFSMLICQKVMSTHLPLDIIWIMNISITFIYVFVVRQSAEHNREGLTREMVWPRHSAESSLSPISVNCHCCKGDDIKFICWAEWKQLKGRTDLQFTKINNELLILLKDYNTYAIKE